MKTHRGKKIVCVSCHLRVYKRNKYYHKFMKGLNVLTDEQLADLIPKFGTVVRGHRRSTPRGGY